MTETDYATAVAILALQKSGRLTQSAARDQQLLWMRENVSGSTIEAVLDHAGFSRPAINATVGEAQKEIDKGLALGVVPLPIRSPDYPGTLRAIADAPPILFVRGSIEVLKRLPGVAVVGTRKASPHGLLISERISQYLSEQGWCVVSGLALGIDAAAHEGALIGGTPTIAVLAHGLEKAQPLANRPLAERILEGGGVWVSEHPVGVGAKPAHFVLRNRIQVGLSCTSIIVEAEEVSGSKTQADFCIRNKRTLFAVLPEPGSKVATISALPRMLVQMRGATPIYSRADYPAMLDVVRKAAASLAA